MTNGLEGLGLLKITEKIVERFLPLFFIGLESDRGKSLFYVGNVGLEQKLLCLEQNLWGIGENLVVFWAKSLLDSLIFWGCCISCYCIDFKEV